jgi:hypothetical protein
MTRESLDSKLVATVWKDSALVYNLSTCYPAQYNQRKDTVMRKIRHKETGKWEKTKLPCPVAISEFNKYMGGVDRSDHLRANYSLQRQSVKWWLYFVWFGVDYALNNAYIIKHSQQPKLTHKAFILKVVLNSYRFISSL